LLPSVSEDLWFLGRPLKSLAILQENDLYAKSSYTGHFESLKKYDERKRNASPSRADIAKKQGISALLNMFTNSIFFDA